MYKNYEMANRKLTLQLYRKVTNLGQQGLGRQVVLQHEPVHDHLHLGNAGA